MIGKPLRSMYKCLLNIPGLQNQIASNFEILILVDFYNSSENPIARFKIQYHNKHTPEMRKLLFVKSKIQVTISGQLFHNWPESQYQILISNNECQKFILEADIFVSNNKLICPYWAELHMNMSL